MVDTYDLIVAGAGPGGSTAAREAASRGLRVLMLDRAEFPRDKPCGGGVNVRSARLLPFDLAPVVEREIRGMAVSVGMGPWWIRRADEPLSYLTQRRRLDTFLAERACEAGVEFRDGTAVRAVNLADRDVTVVAGGATLRARALIAADGANGSTARLAGVRVRRWKGIALEGNVTPARYPEPWRDVFGFDVGTVPGGYGWLFPKGDHLNVGVGGWSFAGPQLRRQLDQMTAFYGLDPASLWGLKGHPLPFRRADSPLASGQVALVGDAAGLIDPLTGEGIFSAIWSGRSAAAHVAAYLAGEEPDLDGYRHDVEGFLMAELTASAEVRDLFHLAPPLWAAFLQRSPRAWGLVCGLMTGDRTYADLFRRYWPVARLLTVASELVRFGMHVKHATERDDLPTPERLYRRIPGLLGESDV